MANTLGDYGQYPFKALGANRVESQAIVPIGASGAVGTIDGDQGWTMARTSAGLYTLTFPITASNARAILEVGILKSPALTVDRAVVTIVSFTAGTATFTTVTGSDTATDPASGDQLWLRLTATIGGAGP